VLISHLSCIYLQCFGVVTSVGLGYDDEDNDDWDDDDDGDGQQH